MPDTPTENDDILVGTPGDDVIDGLGGNDSIRGLGGIDALSGGAGNDFIDGGSGDDQLHGGDDNDYLRGGPGDDLIDGGPGFDRAGYSTAASGVTVDLRIQNFTAQDTGGAGFDTLINIDNVSGSFFSDTLYGNDNANWIWALGPTNGVTPTNDNLYGNGGNDLLQAGTGDHILDGGSGIDTIGFGQPGDILYTTPGTGFGNGIVINLNVQGVAQNTHQGMMTLTSIENVSGSVLDDVLTGNDNANVIAGDAGDDNLTGNGGNDTIYGDGAIGIDSGGTGTSGPITTFTADQGTNFDFYDAAGQLVFLFAGQDLYDAAGNLLAAVVSTDPEDPYTQYSINGDDYYFYVGSSTFSDGVAGNDVIDGGTGDDMLYGGGGNDLLRGGAGPSSGNDTLDGGDGDDYLTGGAGDDTIIGGAGIDRAGYFTATGGVGVTVDLRIVGVAQNTISQGMDTLSGIENVSGTTFADVLTGDDGNNWLWGSTANYQGVFSAANNDTISGMAGNDLITVGIGNQTVDGGADNDTLRFTENGQIVENGIDVSLALQGGAQTTGYGDWTISNFENLSGGQGNDHLTGDGGANRLTGEGGDDTLDGGGGNDILSGDAVYDADTHGLGYSGAARLMFDPDAAPGNDHLDGGTGDDTALFLLAPGAGTLTLGHDGDDLLILRGSETTARISFAGQIVTVQGLNSAAQLGTDTLVNIDHLSFQIEGGGAPLVVDLSIGVVVDGYVAGGTVFGDANNNGVLDPGEVSATTDANGNFNLVNATGPLVMFGGTNVDTGQPNLLTLTAPEGSSVVNPLTTLVQTLVDGGSTLAAAQDKVAVAFGIDTNVDLTSFDPLAAAPGDVDALAVQKASASVVIFVLEGAAAAGGGDLNENAVFDALAGALDGSAVDLTDSSTVTDILQAALPSADVSDVVASINDAASAIAAAGSIQLVSDAQAAELAPPAVDLDGTNSGIDFTAGAYTEGGAAAIGDSITVTAPATPITSATITITDALSGDQLGISGTLPTGITVFSGAGTVVLVLTGSAPEADWEAALSLVRFSSTSENPDAFGTDAARTITATVSDGLNDSLVATATVAISGVDDAPTLSNLAGDNATYTEGDAYVLLDRSTAATVNDPDNMNFAGGSLVVENVANPHAEDEYFVATLGQVATVGGDVFVEGTKIGTISHSGPGQNLEIDFNVAATPSLVAEMIHALAYRNAADDNPIGGARTIQYFLSDGAGATIGLTSSVTVVPVNDPAILSAPVVNLTETNSGTDLSTFGVLTNSDPDSPQTFVAQSMTMGSYGSFRVDAQGIWFYATASAHNEFVGGTIYTDTFPVFSADGTQTSVTIRILGTNDAASIGGTDTGTVTEDAAPISGILSATDVDSDPSFQAGMLTGAYGRLAIDAAGHWTYTLDNSLAAVNVLKPGDHLSDSITVRTSDGTGHAILIDIAGANDAPTLTGFAPTLTVDENVPQVLDADVVFNDPEGNFDGGFLTLSGLLAEDRATIRDEGPGAGQIGVSGTDVTYGGIVIGGFAGGAGASLTVTFNAAATSAAIDALIQNLVFTDVSDAPTASRTLALDVVDADHAYVTHFAPPSGDPFGGVDLGDYSTAAFADLDNDGLPDVVLGEFGGHLVVYHNNGNGTFTQRIGAANPFNGVNGGYSAPAFADVDGDGKLDAVVGTKGGTLRVFHNNGDGTFSELTGAANPFDGVRVDNGGPSYTAKPAFVDLDGDGKLDAVVGEAYGQLLSFHNNGNGTFTRLIGAANPFNGVDVGYRSSPSFVDLDGDGRLDAVVGEANGTLLAFHNEGNGTFTQLVGAANPFDGVDVGGAASPAFGDLDGDGRPDALVGDRDGTLVVLRNNIPVIVTVNAVNDAPVNTVPADGAISGAEDSDIAITGMQISDADADPGATFNVNLIAGHGTLNVSASVTGGATTIIGNGGATIVISGTLAQINATLGDAAAVQFHGDIDFAGITTITLTTSDGGSSGMDPGTSGGTTFEFDADQFSLTVTPVNDAPTLTGFSPTLAVTENDAPQLLDADVTFNDVEGNFAGGSLTLTGLLGEDRAAIWNEGIDPGQIGVSGTDVTYGGIVIGTFAGGVGTTLTVTFNGAATSAGIEALIEHLTYADVSDTPTASRTLTLNVSDGAGGDLLATGNESFTAMTGAGNPFAAVSVGRVSKPELVDFDGDGDLDLVVPQAYGDINAFRNDGGTFTQLTGVANPFAGINGGMITSAAFGDFAGDARPDLLVGMMDGTFHAFRNDNGVFTLLSGASDPFNGIDVGSWADPVFIDVDHDGDMDVIAGTQAGALRYLRNDGGAFTNVATLPISGLINSSPGAVDFDGDGDTDLVVGDFTGIHTYRNDGGTFTEVHDIPIRGFSGARASPGFGDFDGDGDLDMVVGDDLGHVAYLENGGQAVTITVTAVNDAPLVTDPGNLQILEDFTTSPGTTIAAMFSGHFSDPDNGAATIEGIAITANAADAATEGAWQYSTDGGMNWFAVGSVDGASALVLDDSARLRFVPVADYSGSPNALSARGLEAGYAGGFTSGSTHVAIDATVNGGSTAISGNSAEIGVTVTEVNDAPTLSGFAPTLAVTENDAPQLLDANVIFNDVEGNFDGGILILSGLLAEDRAAIRNEGPGAGQIGVSGTDVSYGGIVIGTFAGGLGTTLTVTFNGAATPAAIDALIQNLTYADASDAPIASRTLALDIVDAAGGHIVQPATYTALTGGANPLNGINVGVNSAPTFADIDNDGMPDAVVGGFNGAAHVYHNNGNGTFSEVATPFGALSGQYATPAFVDLDRDGKLDAVVGVKDGTLRALHNNGNGTFTQLVGAANPFDGVDVGDNSTPSFVDLDGDGRLDAVVGESYGGLLSFHNNGNGTFTQLVGAANPFDGVDVGFHSAPTFVDVDRDGRLDAVVGDVFGHLSTFHNNGDGSFTELLSAANPFNGFQVVYSATPTFFDLDGDGRLDAVVGSADGPLSTFHDSTPTSLPLTVTVTAVNDAPVNTVPADGAISGDEDSSFAITGMQISDVDADPGAQIVVNLIATHGTLNVSASVAGGATSIIGNGGTLVVVSGTLSQINATLGNAAAVQFHGDADYNGTAGITLTTNDGGSSGVDPGATGGTNFEFDADQFSITITPVNDAPVANADVHLLVIEDNTSLFSTELTGNDTDIDGDTPTITGVSNVQHGTALVAAGVVQFHPDHDYVGSAQFDYTIDDGHGGTSTATAQLDVVGINDPPTVSIAALGPATEQVPLDLKGIVTLADPDADSGFFTPIFVTLHVDHGIIHIDPGTVTLYTGLTGNDAIAGNDTDTVMLTGHLAEIQALLAAGGDSIVTYTQPDDAPPATDTLTVTIDDNGQFGSGIRSTAVDTEVFNIMAVNDAPILSNYDHVIAASGIGPIDLRIAAPVDPDGDPLTVNIDHVPGYGVVEYFDGTDWVVAGDGESVTAAELATLRYTPPTSGAFDGGSITYSASDGTLTSQGTITIASQVVSSDPPQLLFSASDANDHNPDLYTVDSAGALHAAPINPPNGSFAGDGSGFVQFGGDTYFMAVNNVASFGGLFRLGSSGAASLVDAGGGAYFGSQIGANPHFTLFAGGLYFAGDVDGEGSVAIRLNADRSHTSFNVNGNNQNMAGANGGFVAFDGSLFFSAVTTLTNGNNSPDLIRLDQDGTTHEITTRGAGLEQYGSFAGEDGGFVVFNNALYFNAYYDVSGDTLFRLDAGSNTPVAVNPAGTIFDHINSGGIDSAFHVFAGSLYFNEFSSASGGNSLFKLDASGDLTEIQYLNSASAYENLVGAGAIGGFIDFAGSTWFTASTSETGLDLFRLDDCGCLEAIDVNIGPADAFDSNLVSGFTVFDGALYFDAYDGTGGDSLFRLDALGHLDLVDLGGNPGGTTLAGVEGGFKEAFGSLFFSAYTGDGYEIVRLEKDGSYTDYDINPGPGGNAVVPGDGQTFGLLNANILTGTGDNDIIAGSAANESLSGGSGNDVLESRGGNDDLTGGDGADLFVLSQSGAANLVTIDDYDFIAGDKVDLSALLDAGFGPNSNVSDFARLFAVEGDIKLQVDLDGAANGANWTDVAILPGGNSFGLDSVEVHFNDADYVVTESLQTNVQTIALAGGGWAVTWTQVSYEEGDLYENVFGRVFAADGSQTGGTFQVSATDNAMDDANNLTVALASGDFAVVWQACDNEIWTRVYHADGTPATAPEAVQPPDPNVLDVLPGGIIALSNGGYAVLWGQSEAGGDDIYISTFAADGTPGSGPVLVDSSSQDDDLTSNFGAPIASDEATQILKLQDGFAVTWLSERDTGPGGATETSVFVRVFQNDGTPITGEIQANSADHGVTSADGGTEDFFPVLVALGGNDFAVQWESDDVPGGSQQIFARIFDDSDYEAGAPLRLDANNDANVLAETWNASPLVNGGFVALWDQYDSSIPSPDTPSDIYIQVFDAAGQIAAGSSAGGLIVNQVSGVSNLPTQVLGLAGGGFAVLFASVRDDGVGSGPDVDAYVRTYAADGTPTSGEMRVNAANDSDDFGLALEALPGGGFVVLWEQQELTANGLRTDIMVQALGADASPLSSVVMLGSTPSDLSYAQELSIITEFRDAIAANGHLLAAAIAGETVDFFNFVTSLQISSLLNYAPLVDLNTATSGVDDINSYTEGDVGQAIGTAIGITDIDAGDMVHGATVAISDPETGDLLFANLPLPGGITIDVANSTDTVLVLTGTASAADYEAALGQLGFRSTSDDPTAGGIHNSRSIEVTIDDGTASSAPATMTMTVFGVNDEPTLTATGQNPTYIENGAAVTLFGAAAASTVEANQNLTSLTLTVTHVTDGASEHLFIDGSSVALTDGNSVTTATHGLNVGVTLAGSTATLTFSGASLSAGDLQALVGGLTYANSSENPTSADRVVTITQVADSGSNAAPNDNSTALSISSTVHVVAVIDPPLLDLDNATGGSGSSVSFAEGNGPVLLAAAGTVADLDSPNFAGGTLTVQFTSGAQIDDMLQVVGLDLDAGGILLNDDGEAYVAGGTDPATPLVITFAVSATASEVQDVLRMIGYVDYSNGAIGGDRTISFTLTDGHGGTSNLATATVHVTAVDTPPELEDDVAITDEASPIIIVVLANDNDPDGPPLAVAQIDGQAISVGQTIALLSGATVRLEANGTLTYNPNGQFGTLTSPAGGEIGAVNTSAPDSFTYTLASGGTATVSVTVNGIANATDHLKGDVDDNIVTGTGLGDFFDLSQGGNDTATGLGGNDGFFFGAAFTAADHVDGGAGINDQIGLQGDYTGGNALVLGANTITNIEAIVVLPGFSYDITTVDANVAAGGVLNVQATQLAPGQSLHFDGSAESDGAFKVFGGNGDDNFTGGAGNDGFYFGPGGFNSSDIVNGGAGTNDQLALDGDYTITLGGNVTNVEVLVLLHGLVATPNTFDVTSSDAFVAAGQTMTVFGLQVETGILFDGSGEIDGAFKIYGGTNADTLTGGHGDDWIFGGNGADNLTGGAGNDIFYYDMVAQSTAANGDTIFDFATGDKVDVSGIDAVSGGANDAFSFLGSGAFTNHAGELRAENIGGNTWLVQGDTNGDGTADFQLTLITSDAHPIATGDFTL